VGRCGGAAAKEASSSLDANFKSILAKKMKRITMMLFLIRTKKMDRSI